MPPAPSHDLATSKDNNPEAPTVPQESQESRVDLKDKLESEQGVFLSAEIMTIVETAKKAATEAFTLAIITALDKKIRDLGTNYNINLQDPQNFNLLLRVISNFLNVVRENSSDRTIPPETLRAILEEYVYPNLSSSLTGLAFLANATGDPHDIIPLPNQITDKIMEVLNILAPEPATVSKSLNLFNTLVTALCSKYITGESLAAKLFTKVLSTIDDRMKPYFNVVLGIHLGEQPNSSMPTNEEPKKRIQTLALGLIPALRESVTPRVESEG